MVSPLWKACSEGNLENVVQLLKEATPVDIELKDHTGATPLIEAVKGGHVEIVRVLLDKGADPTNASSQGPPESYTSDPVIHGLISVARGKMAHATAQPQEPSYPQDLSVEPANMDPTAGYYPPPGAYYYPHMPVPPPMMPDGTMPYYVPPPIPTDQNQPGFGNLPPPEIARMIPCRYYPACRYGTSCMFAHPQGPYMQRPLPPPAQYPAPYDPMNPGPYPPPTYYPVPPSYGPSPNGAPVNPMSPTQPMAHGRSGSEIMSPIQGPFSPVNGQPPMPFGVSPVSTTYGHSGPAPMLGSIPPLSPLQIHPTSAQSPPPQAMYPPISPGAQSMSHPYAISTQFPPQGIVRNGEVADVVSPKPVLQGHQHGENYGPGPMNREAMTHHRRGSTRRPSFGGRVGKPPCLFFPSGRCRNGDECRFPHVLPDGPTGHHSPHFAPRGGPRPRPPFHNHGMAVLEDKFAALSTQDDKGQAQNRNGAGTTTSESSRSQSAEPSLKGRAQNFKPNQFANGPRPDRKFAPPKLQRVPNADEFPVLGGSSPSISRGPSVNGSVTSAYSGPTAAQVLQAPPPVRKDLQVTRGSSPEQTSPAQTDKDGNKETNGVIPNPPVEQHVNKLPLSFAAAATAVADGIKEVSVSA
ncbi:hypothetical protein BC628DRAFT_1416101 [Trametes gibbosa]|uniref:C3H1-type domain-containing protein n=1 Tax=Trametes gibbosa TaxID=160864 RepID=A0A6G6FQM4_9APHY|nr:hypothetical protein BC628DRAFT_1416101 [Trametes gibbosa]QIE48483.1 hypothetical protein [Trametes gibbosa]